MRISGPSARLLVVPCILAYLATTPAGYGPAEGAELGQRVETVVYVTVGKTGRRSRLFRVDLDGRRLRRVGRTGYDDVTALAFGGPSIVDPNGARRRTLYGIGREPGNSDSLTVIRIDEVTGRGTPVQEIRIVEDGPQPEVIDMDFKPTDLWNLFVLTNPIEPGPSNYFKIDRDGVVVERHPLPPDGARARTASFTILRRAVIADGTALEAYRVPGTAFEPLEMVGRSSLEFAHRRSVGPLTGMAHCSGTRATSVWAVVEPTGRRRYLATLDLRQNLYEGRVDRRFGMGRRVLGIACNDRFVPDNDLVQQNGRPPAGESTGASTRDMDAEP